MSPMNSLRLRQWIVPMAFDVLSTTTIRLGLIVLFAHIVISFNTTADSKLEKCCRYHHLFKDADWSDPEVQERFRRFTIFWERRFFNAAGVAFDADTGMTYDGHALDPTTGDLLTGNWPGGPRVWSAASKESLHISMIALALDGNHSEVLNISEALSVLERKVKSLERFDRKYPAFGGFLPWFCSRGSKGFAPGVVCRDLSDTYSGIAPTHDWQNRIPGLDNGQFAWAVYALVHVLQSRAKHCRRSAALALRWGRRLDKMKRNGVKLFYEGPGSGKVRAVAIIQDMKRGLVYGNIRTEPSDDAAMPVHLDDPYEGELTVLFLDLIADWADYSDAGAADKALIWQHKQKKLVAVNYTGLDAPTVVQQGHWFSAHEQWKIMVLPYLDIPVVRQVFENCEHVRLYHSAKLGIPGLFASASPPRGVQCAVSGYCSATGIQDVARLKIEHTESVSPYGAFPAIMTKKSAGLAWYHRTLSLPQMQTLYGSVESSHIDGTTVAPLLTWDAKVTTVLAMLGGTASILRTRLETDGLLARFYSIIGRVYLEEFDHAFSSAGQGTREFAKPPPAPGKHWLWHSIFGSNTDDFPTCRCQDEDVEL